jgi:hypothetical protein
MSLMRERGYEDAGQQLAVLLSNPALRDRLVGQPPFT